MLNGALKSKAAVLKVSKKIFMKAKIKPLKKEESLTVTQPCRLEVYPWKRDDLYGR